MTIAADAPLGVVEIPMTLDYYATMERLEKDYLRRILERNLGKLDFTARQIGINKTTLLRRVKTYGLSSWGR